MNTDVKQIVVSYSRANHTEALTKQNTQTGKFALHNQDLGWAILEQATQRFGQMFLWRAFWKSASAKCYCAVWKVYETHIIRMQNQ